MISEDFFVALQFEIILEIFISMKANTLENENAFVAEVPHSIEDIKSCYPDEWILLGNPKRDEQRHTKQKTERKHVIYLLLIFCNH